MWGIKLWFNMMKDDRLVTSLKPIMIKIDKYQKLDFCFNGYHIFDYYDPPLRNKQEDPFSQKTDFYGRYSISIESACIVDIKDLSRAVKESNDLAKTITLIAKCFLGQALNTPPQYYDSNVIEYDQAEDPIDGWESNHSSVRMHLHKNGKCIITSIHAVSERFFQCTESPFAGLEKALIAYSSMSQTSKDLLLIINDVDIVSPSSRFMLLGKAIEIVDSLYPLAGLNNYDTRIRTLFPDIADSFKGVTIKNLRGLANSRKETRHYIDKHRVVHPEMTDDERRNYYECTNLLCINVVRKELGFDTIVFNHAAGQL